MPDLSLSVKFVRSIGAAGKYFLFWSPQKLLISLLFAPVLIYVGNKIKSMGIKMELFEKKYFLIMLFILFGSVIYLSFLPAVYVMSEAGPLRSWYHIGIYQVVFFGVLFFYAGYKFNLAFIRPSFVTIYLIAISAGHVGFLAFQMHKVQQYAYAVDKRNYFLAELKKRNYIGVAELEKLPDPGYLFSAEIGEDKDYFLNEFLKRSMRLHYEVRERSD